MSGAADRLESGRLELGRLDLARPGRSVEVAHSLLGYLLSGELKPGDRIPSERTLTQTLGVGRGPVREALKSLTLLDCWTSGRATAPSCRARIPACCRGSSSGASCSARSTSRT